MQRHRYATRQELVQLLAGDVPEVDVTVVEAFVQALEDRYVPVNALVKVFADESVD
jgi:hypothetical protein